MSPTSQQPTMLPHLVQLVELCPEAHHPLLQGGQLALGLPQLLPASVTVPSLLLVALDQLTVERIIRSTLSTHS